MLLGLASEGTSTVSVGLRGFGDEKSPSESRGVLSDRRLGISHRRMVEVPLAVHNRWSSMTTILLIPSQECFVES